MDLSTMLAPADHRPWPMPKRPWRMAMVWHDLLFAHWPVDKTLLREHVPPSLAIDTFDGQAWIGVVPFTMSGIRARCTPAIPGLSAFPEINVRTYVRAEDKPGVWFFSLDAAHLSAVLAARGTYRLPYYWARMDAQADGPRVHYRSARRRIAGGIAQFQATYGPATPSSSSDAPPADNDPLARWLTERYCLYTIGRDGLPRRAEIHHAPWPLVPAEADIRINTMTAPLGMTLPDTDPLLHFAHRLDVIAWGLERVATKS